MWKRLFAEHGAKDTITLFHKPSMAESIRVLTLLKKANAASVTTATEDRASSHAEQSKAERAEFVLDVTEAPPTPDQLRSILQYMGDQGAAKVILGARDEEDAMKKLFENSESFQRPLVVDWNSGKAVVGDNQSEILKLLKSITKDTDAA